ncbi:MAG: glycoside hydrolase family 3 C-terminal domain-containing protein [Bacteroidaceae bacterium]|nr:glycoside hydrolase family 3 C-terminal domain-containing protein [Bacteroidaceae bacterium]
MKTTVFFVASLLSISAFAQKPVLPKDAEIEAKVQAQLQKMTLEEKIGQMVELEINMITYNDPTYSMQKIMFMDEKELDQTIRKFGLQNQYKASELVAKTPEDRQNMQKMIALYGLSNAITSKLPFKIDEVALDSVINKYKVGSILNAPRTTAQTPEVWNYVVKTIQDASMKGLGIPDIYGLDQMHGTTYTAGGTLFPSAINMAATFNRDLTFKMGEIVAYETRACNVPWIYGPDIDLARNQAWSRQYEGFGEDVYLSSEMGRAAVRGMQGTDPNHIDKYHVASTLKHYFAYGVPNNGLDRTPAILSDQELREKQFAPFLAAFKEGALSIMTNSSIVNNMNGVANRRFLTDWLKRDLNWDGMIVTDWADIENLRTRDHIAATQKEAIQMAINAGVDMMMVPSQFTYNALLKQLVEEGGVSMDRINDATARVLRLKYRLGLFDTPNTLKEDYPKFGSAEFAAYSRQAALESEVLLKNENNILPLQKGKKILVAGPNANSMRTLNGGWSYTWQGDGAGREEFTGKYNTIYEALQNKFGKKNVTLVEGVRYEGGNWQDEVADGIDAAVKAAAGVDYIVVCVGENTYAETTGNIADVNLSPNQKELVKALAATGKPVVMVLNEGRARTIYDIEPLVQGIVHTLLPGNYGGDALAELLAGDANFSGRLPYTYSSKPNAFVNYDYKACEVRGTMSGVYDYDAKTYEQWWFGAGLSYTTYEYSNLKASKTEFTKDDVLTFTVDVKNTGKMAGKEVVMLYSSDLYASLMPDNKRLRAFEKIELQPGETKTVTLKVKASDLAFVGANNQWTLEAGDFNIIVGKQILPIKCLGTYSWPTPNIMD